MSRWASALALAALFGCGGQLPRVDAGPADSGVSDAGVADAGVADAGVAGSPFASQVISFDAGAGSGFGKASFPQIVLGPPQGTGDSIGSYDVLSLGLNGEIVLGLDGRSIVDGPGVDLLVFENAFIGFVETGFVAVSDDGTTWHEWPCAPTDVDAGYPGCAGVHPVYSSSSSGISAVDPAVAGGDGFDLATLGVTRARFVRIRDSGNNRYGAPSGGFDLDAIAIIHSQ